MTGQKKIAGLLVLKLSQNFKIHRGTSLRHRFFGPGKSFENFEHHQEIVLVVSARNGFATSAKIIHRLLRFAGKTQGQVVQDNFATEADHMKEKKRKGPRH